MMNAVSCHPENRSTFERESCAYCQEILHPLGGFVTAMGQQSVIAHADSHTASSPPKDCRNQQCLPGKKEERSDGSNVKCGHKAGGDPVNFAVRSGFAI